MPEREWVVEDLICEGWSEFCGSATRANAKMIAEAMLVAGFSTRARIRNTRTGEIMEVRAAGRGEVE